MTRAERLLFSFNPYREEVYIFVGPFARRVRSSMKVILLDAI
jgi:hypothetical protein